MLRDVLPKKRSLSTRLAGRIAKRCNALLPNIPSTVAAIARDGVGPRRKASEGCGDRTAIILLIVRQPPVTDERLDEAVSEDARDVHFPLPAALTQPPHTQGAGRGVLWLKLVTQAH